MGEAVAVATCPEALVPSVGGLVPRLPKVNAGRAGASFAGLGAAKEKPDAEGKIEGAVEAALKEKREDVVEGRLKETPKEEEAGAAGAAEVVGGAEVEAGVIGGTWNDEKTGGGGLDVAGA